MSERLPSRALLIAAGVVTQLCAAACLVLGLASLPIVHDLHAGLHGVVAGIVAAFVAFVCGALVWGGRLVPLALAAGLDLGFGIALPRGSAIGALLRILPGSESATATHLVDALAVAMFAAAVLCIGAVPSALARRRWWRDEATRAPDRAPHPADTLKGVVPARPTVTLQVHAPAPASRSRAAVVIAVAATLVLVGGIAIFAASSGGSAAPADHAAPAARASGAAPADASHAADAPAVVAVAQPPVDAPAADAATPPVDDLVTRLDAALGRANAADVVPLLSLDAFGFGIDAHEVAQGAQAVAAVVHADLGAGGPVEVRYAQVGQEGDVAWLAQDVTIGGHPFVLSAVAGLDGGAWTVHALSLAVAVPNDTAHELARDGELSVPDAIPDTHDDSPLAQAMRDALASLPSFVAARSERDDAFNFGSAPGERIRGGRAIAHAFGRLRATLRLHDAVHVGAIGAKGGWGVANVDFTDADRGGTAVTQTFRVLAAWLQEDAGWRIVQTQFSNAR
jgi:hypothetical protein